MVHGPCGGSGNMCEEPIIGGCGLVRCGFIFVHDLSGRRVRPQGQRCLSEAYRALWLAQMWGRTPGS